MSERCAIVTLTPSSSVSTLGILVTNSTIASGGNWSSRKAKFPYLYSNACSWAFRMRSVPSEMRGNRTDAGYRAPSSPYQRLPQLRASCTPRGL